MIFIISAEFLCFTGVLNDESARIDNQIEYVENEIEIRIESLKSSLDNLITNFKRELNELKKVFTRYNHRLITSHILT